MLKHFPKQFEKATPTDIFNEVNYVKPSLIRTESDELTYHYHIMIRYEIEKMLIENTLQVKDVVSYWNESYKKFLDLDVPNDAKGALQDIHWSMGGMGYFPTYSQGSFYASQWYEEISKSNNLDQMIKNQEFKKIQKWHNEHIHVHGKLLNSNEICEKATGNKLSFYSFENYIKQKFDI
jgi:carboxypeptidase Taq